MKKIICLVVFLWSTVLFACDKDVCLEKLSLSTQETIKSVGLLEYFVASENKILATSSFLLVNKNIEASMRIMRHILDVHKKELTREEIALCGMSLRVMHESSTTLEKKGKIVKEMYSKEKE